MEPKQSRLEKLLSLIRVSLPEAVLGLILITGLLLAAATSAYLTNFPLLSDLQSSFNTFTDQLGAELDTPFVTNVVSLFFWALVGLTLYSLLWALFVVLIDLRNDIVVSEHFLHPRSFHKSDFWLASISRRIIIVTAYTVIAAYIFLLLSSLPIVYDTFRDLFLQGFQQLPMTTLSSLLAFGSWLLGWHVVIVIRRFSVSIAKEV
jgi:hypothetical protein